jgi:hypothetical protein
MAASAGKAQHSGARLQHGGMPKMKHGRNAKRVRQRRRHGCRRPQETQAARFDATDYRKGKPIPHRQCFLTSHSARLGVQLAFVVAEKVVRCGHFLNHGVRHFLDAVAEHARDAAATLFVDAARQQRLDPLIPIGCEPVPGRKIARRYPAVLLEPQVQRVAAPVTLVVVAQANECGGCRGVGRGATALALF